MIKNRFLIFLFLHFVLSHTCYVHAFKFTPEICHKYGLGKNWYCEPEEDENERVSQISAREIMTLPVSPEFKAELLNELWEVQRKRAVITGQKEDLEKFIETQYLIAQYGVDFAKNIQHIVNFNPQYSNQSSDYKTMSEARVSAAKREELLKKANSRYYIAFIYKAECPYCASQLPILMGLREKFGIKILGISVNGGHYEGLDNSIIDTDVADDPEVQAFPTIMLVDKKEPKKIFISKGLSTQDQLESKIYQRILENEAGDKNEK